MNSDPHESAAWRMFGMLDADEAASFDESIRDDPELRNAWREMNSLSAAVAAAATTPITPRAGQLDRLRSRLGLNASKPTNWLAITGWAAAAVLTMTLLLDRKIPTRPDQAANSPHPVPAKHDVEIVERVSKREVPLAGKQAKSVDSDSDNERPSRTDGVIQPQESGVRTVAKVETKRLIQEIEVLREKLESIQKRDQKRFETLPGMAWPIVMTMKPPHGDKTIIAADDQAPSITSVLGDALAGSSSLVSPPATLATTEEAPSAVPIYDPSTGEGTLVINLAKIASNTPKSLWFKPEGSDTQPVFLGSLPSSSLDGPESVGFTLRAGTIPSNFIITSDTNGKNAPPSAGNTILIGPQ